MSQLRVDDLWVEHPRGRMFVRTWTPSSLANERAPIVLLHDSLGSVELWRGFPIALAEATRRRVIAYDRLGFGQSEQRAETMPDDFVEGEARDYFGQIKDQLGLEDFIVFGHSVGGGMSTYVAAKYPKNCLAIITEAAQNFVEDRTRSGIFAALENFQRPGQFERLEKYHGDKAQWVLDSWVNTWTSQAFNDWSIDAALPGVLCPSLIIHGELDEYGSVLHPQQIAERVAGPARCVILPGIHHVPHREVESQIVELVVEFLQEIR